MTYTVGELAAVCGGRLNDPSCAEKSVRMVGAIDTATDDMITWITDRPHAKHLSTTRAAAIIGTNDLLAGHPRGIVVEDPEWMIALVLERFLLPTTHPAIGVHPTAVVAETAVLGPMVAIGAHAVVHSGATVGEGAILRDGVSVGAGVTIGKHCVIHARCVIYDHCQLGDRVILHAGTVIGGDGFGYVFREGQHRKVPHVGIVVIEDDVEIGAQCCVDRAKFGATRIGRGTKFDNQVHIAHNVQVGPLCLLTAQTGIAGSVRLGTGVVTGGRVGVIQGLTVGDGARIATSSLAWHDIPAGQTVSGTPSRDHREELQERARVRMLPRLFEQVKELLRRVTNLETSANHPERD